MRHFNISKFLSFSVAAAILCGCSMSERSQQHALVGGAAGTVVGAGTGAAVGAAIANGDIATSALLGGAIGLPIGIVAGLAFQNMEEQSEINQNDSRIRANQSRIQSTQKEIEDYREKLLAESNDIEIDESKGEHKYIGPSLGNYYR
jgi:uncharacterized membrane protein YebE (DUF533 family)